ncbi:MAG TPA: C45 family peptidase [Anaeromyxobacteraceae bacterium]|nr:C45 family peptidase [Anaeromyxobacteraceae bacterium]
MAFDLVDVDLADGRGWCVALAEHRGAALRLLEGFDRQCLEQATAARGRAGRIGFTALRRLLSVIVAHRCGAHAAEIAAMAAELGVPRAALLFANLAYDVAATAPLRMVAPLGCSTFVTAAAGEAPLHARNLDWHFPGELLREHPVVFRVRGAPAGPYLSVGWPGLTGALTAVAPGRFSISVNFVKDRRDGFGRLFARAARGALPVAWAVRHALERARDFDGAVTLLRDVPLLAPVLLTVAGIRAGEACVLERSARAAGVRRCAGGAVCVTNHYASPELGGRSVDYDAGDTLVRLEAVTTGLATRAPSGVDDALAVLAPAVRGHTQYQAVMRAADGLLAVRVPGSALASIAAA